MVEAGREKPGARPGRRRRGSPGGVEPLQQANNYIRRHRIAEAITAAHPYGRRIAAVTDVPFLPGGSSRVEWPECPTAITARIGPRVP
ncbi:imidazolonepropionase-like amidohydrolase [Saccharothrix violaceirubra]|uniref:Imidazolonepropionase-like amidohydrolase n=1 Tax=Saccharothrix violaceirubra TaxID=413306 RepID=A0A7W7WW97_9PSEU|nr:imidazolonepropionase-like amidohydrolase [Saccharothrix violaceirubra]